MDKIFKIALLALLVGLTSCVNVNKLKVTSVHLDSITPSGLRSLVGVASATVENPSAAFSVYDVSGTVKRQGQALGTFSVDPVNISGRTTQSYTVSGQFNLSPSISMLEVLSLVQKINIDELSVDLSLTVKPKGGAAKKLNLKDVPVRSAVQMIKSGNI